MDLLDELSTRVLCGDGAMGTLLMDAAGLGGDERCLEEFCLSAPDLVAKIHRDYLDAGARLIETNTFGANAARLSRHRLENKVNELNWTAAQLARDAARGRNAYVAGSVGPTGLSEEQARELGLDRAAAFREQLGALLDGGVDLIMLETFLDLDELLLALEIKQSLHHCPVVCSLACAEEGRLPSGVTITDAFARLRAAGADIVGVNCLNGPNAMLRLLEHVPVEPGELLSAFPNAGYPRYVEGRFLYPTAPDYFANAARGLVAAGARLVGGCCGTTPAQIAAMSAAIADLAPVVRKPVLKPIPPLPEIGPMRPAIAITPPPPLNLSTSSEEESILDKIAAGKTVIITELDPPKTLDLEKFFAGAQALTAAGSDAITLADNSLAILRVSNLAAGAMLKHRFGITPLLHLSCRDRNLLGLQSELLGLAALGIRHVLPLTGDPAKVGDHPGAKSVYDVTSVQLMSIAARLNEGFNHVGKTIKNPTRFVIGCTFNPNAKHLDAQVARLERKVAAGARYVMTQPIFDPAQAKIVAARTAHLNVPIFLGIWPLLNGRQAEFLHNEVPGILIPDDVRARMAGREGIDGRNEGVEIAKDVCRAALDHFPGVYLITPFLTYETTVALAQFVRGISK
ncbi:MAG: bifunctional homocysteine S-methyltransferase/methylenetetrahydrofolate reductase [Verrucomicrobia bacterium]|nr:bifunctional homocysteine S-methyltransferase/methylenetetrahydrofolate reductase [Verrucomicrobiota bacterium]